MANSLQDETFGRLEWDAQARRYVGRFEFRPHELVEVWLSQPKTCKGDVKTLLKFARRQLAHMRRGEAGYRGYRRRAAKELLHRRPGPKSAAVENRLAESLRLERLAFDDDGLSALYYGRAGVPSVQAAVAIDANGKVMLVDTRTRSEVKVAQRTYLAGRAAEKRGTATPDRFMDKTFGPLTREPVVDRYVGRFEFRPGLTVDVAHYLSGNSGGVTETLRFARAQIRHMRRGEIRYRRRVAKELRDRDATGREAVSQVALAAALQITRVEFGEDGESLLYFSTNGPTGQGAAVQIGDRGQIEGAELG